MSSLPTILIDRLDCRSKHSCAVQESADDLVKLYKRVSLDDDLDDQLRSQLLSQLSAGATSTLSTLRLVSTMISPNDDLFDRLETVRFFRLFTGEGDMGNTGRGNTEPRGLKARVLP